MFGLGKKDGQQNFYGLRGTKLNVAIAVIAGTDFALFGYDQVTLIPLSKRCQRTDTVLGRSRRIAYSSLIPEVLPTSQRGRPSERVERSESL